MTSRNTGEIIPHVTYWGLGSQEVTIEYVQEQSGCLRCNGSLSSVTNLPKYGWLRPEHEFDILAYVSVAVDPHKSNKLPEAGPEDGEPSAVGVHKVKHVLPRCGDARQSQ